MVPGARCWPCAGSGPRGPRPGPGAIGPKAAQASVLRGADPQCSEGMGSVLARKYLRQVSRVECALAGALLRVAELEERPEEKKPRRTSQRRGQI